MKEDQLTFDPQTHIYRLNDVPIPSVTQIMQPLSRHKYRDIDEETLNHAAERGTAVHSAIEFYDRFGLDECEGEARPYFEAYLDWSRKYRPKIISNEKPTWHKHLLYAGTVDMLAEVMGKLTLIDFKTTATLNDMLTTVQLEAYRRALDTQDPYHPIMQTAILQLKPDGTYTWKTYKAPDLEAWQTFTALITIRAHIIKYGG